MWMSPLDVGGSSGVGGSFGCADRSIGCGWVFWLCQGYLLYITSQFVLLWTTREWRSTIHSLSLLPSHIVCVLVVRFTQWW